MQTLRTKLFGDLRTQRGAFFAVWLTIVLGLSAYGSTYPAGIAMLDSFDATYDEFNYADFNAHLESPAEADTLLTAVADIEGVDAAAGRLVTDVGLALGEVNRITLRMISIPESGVYGVNDILVVDGELPSTAGDMLLLESFADFHGIRPGDTLVIQSGNQQIERRITGLAFSTEYIAAGQSPINPFPQPNSFGVAYALETDLTAILDIEAGLINDIVLTTTEGTDEVAVRSDLETVLADYETEYLYSRLQTASGGVIDANATGNMAVAAFFSAMFLAIGGLVMAVLLARLMEAETRRIGTMRALGLSRGEALRHYLGFPIIIGVSGALVGSIIGYAMSYLVAAFFIQNLAGGSLPTWVNSPQWAYILFGALVTIVLALLAGAIPTWRASGTDPGLALRPVTPKGMGRQAQVSIPGLPLSAQQALRNILRVPTRTLNTLVGVVLGGTVILAASGTADSTLRSVDVQLESGILYDLQVVWEAPLPAGNIDSQLADMGEVADYQLALLGPVTAQHGEHLLDTLASSFTSADDYYNFRVIDGEAVFSREDAVWIGHNLARVLQVETGDVLTLDALGQTVEAEVAGVVDQSMGSPVYIPTALMRSWTPLGAHVVNTAFVRVEEGQLAAAQQVLADLNGVVAIDVISLTTEDVGNYVSFYVNFAYIFMAFGYLLTLVVVFNTVSINLRERHEELLIMRSMGAQLNEIAATVTWETLSVALIGVLLSVPLGWFAMDYLLNNYDVDFYSMLNVISPSSYLLAFIGVVVVVLLAEWLSLRGLRHADLGKLSKSLSM
jgi:putative ABC transport system permease protein